MLEANALTLAHAITRDFPTDSADDWWIASQHPSARVIDCVLSLRKDYKKVVLPRVKSFLASYPTTISCQDLATLITSFPSTQEFTSRALRLNAPALGDRLMSVTQYLIKSQQRFDYAAEEARLRAWATSASPRDFRKLNAKGFALAGFQYLRMLFGADTAKPDVHIIRYVADVLGHKVSDIDTLFILERAGEIAGRSIRRLDNVIWQRGANGSDTRDSCRPCHQ